MPTLAMNEMKNFKSSNSKKNNKQKSSKQEDDEEEEKEQVRKLLHIKRRVA